MINLEDKCPDFIELMKKKKSLSLQYKIIKNKLLLILLFLFANLLNAQNITFKELESFKSTSISSMQNRLKGNNYEYLKTTDRGTIWRAKDGSGQIGSNGKGVILFMTYNYTLSKKIVEDMKKASYKNTGTTTRDNKMVVSYEKEKTIILFSKITNPVDGKIVYSITITY